MNRSLAVEECTLDVLRDFNVCLRKFLLTFLYLAHKRVAKIKIPNIIHVLKCRRQRWAGHVARMGRGEMHTGFWWGNLKEGDYFEEEA